MFSQFIEVIYRLLRMKQKVGNIYRENIEQIPIDPVNLIERIIILDKPPSNQNNGNTAPPTYANGFPDYNAMPQQPQQNNNANNNAQNNPANTPSVNTAAKIFEGYDNKQQGAAQAGGYSWSANSGYQVSVNPVTNLNQGQIDLVKAAQQHHEKHQEALGISGGQQSLYSNIISNSNEAYSSIAGKMNGNVDSSKMKETMEIEAKGLAEKVKCFFGGDCKPEITLTNPVISLSGAQSNASINSSSSSFSSSSFGAFGSGFFTTSSFSSNGIGGSEQYEVKIIKLDQSR